MNDLLSTAKRKKAGPSTSGGTSNNKQKSASVSVETSEVTKGKKLPSQVSKRQTAKKEEPPKKTSPARLAPKNKSKKEVPSRASPRGQEKSTNQKRGKPESTRLDSPMANISIDDEKENKRSSPRKRNRDSSSGSQSSQSSQSSQVIFFLSGNFWLLGRRSFYKNNSEIYTKERSKIRETSKGGQKSRGANNENAVW